MTPKFFRQYPLKRKWLLLILSLPLLYLPSVDRLFLPAQARSKNTTLSQATFQVSEKKLQILRCHDGDTCTGKDERNLKYTLRLVGIDAPEVAWAGKKGQEYGTEAKKFLESQVKGKNISVRLLGVDRYGRFLALLLDEGKKNKSESFNEQMLLEGYAFAYRGYGADPKILEWAEAAESSAKKNEKGLWALKIKPIDPSQFRKKTRN